MFTGGIAPTLWRPIVAYPALDLPSFCIDLTPFVPIQADGGPHNISLDVLSAESNHSINQNWYVTANLQVTLDKSSSPTTGRMMLYQVDPYAHASTSGNARRKGGSDFTLSASRSLRIESQIRTGSGTETHVVWTQSLSYSNAQTYAKNATVQVSACNLVILWLCY